MEKEHINPDYKETDLTKDSIDNTITNDIPDSSKVDDVKKHSDDKGQIVGGEEKPAISSYPYKATVKALQRGDLFYLVGDNYDNHALMKVIDLMPSQDGSSTDLVVKFTDSTFNILHGVTVDEPVLVSGNDENTDDVDGTDVSHKVRLYDTNPIQLKKGSVYATTKLPHTWKEVKEIRDLDDGNGHLFVVTYKVVASDVPEELNDESVEVLQNGQLVNTNYKNRRKLSDGVLESFGQMGDVYFLDGTEAEARDNTSKMTNKEIISRHMEVDKPDDSDDYDDDNHDNVVSTDDTLTKGSIHVDIKDVNSKFHIVNDNDTQITD